MIKASINDLMPVYYKLFNAVLNSRSMPQTWCGGLITPIYKSGGRSDPSNYRGICVSSCLGKRVEKATRVCHHQSYTTQVTDRLHS